MALAYRVQTVHTGLAGGPYLSVFNFLIGAGGDPQEMGDLVTTFWENVVDSLGNGLTAENDTEVQAFDESTGQTVATFQINSVPVNGTGGAVEWTAKQGILRLRTPDFRAGRRVQGRLFMPGVPTEDGEQTPNAGYTSEVGAAADSLKNSAAANGTPWCVYSRPRSLPTPREGACYPITTTAVANYWGVLRSRR